MSDDNVTPIKQLINDRDSQENSVIIDEILAEINKTTPNTNRTDPPNITMNGGIAPQETPYQMPHEEQEEPVPQEPSVPHPAVGATVPQELTVPKELDQQDETVAYSKNLDNILNTDDTVLQNLESAEKTFSFIKDSIVNEIKSPLLVLILFVIMNTDGVDNIFVNSNSNIFVDNSGKITFLSVLIKAILVSLLFYVTKLFI